MPRNQKKQIIPSLKNIDHVHIYVADRPAAVKWYADVLGFTPIKAFLSWAGNGGPMTLENPGSKIHLALFERPDATPASTVAFGASASAFLLWIDHLKSKGLDVRVSDHNMAYSLYFSDPDGNLYEITSYETAPIRAALE